MNYLFICVISVFLTITLSHDSRGKVLRAPFYFSYENGADLNVKVILKNKPADMDFKIHTWCSSILSEEIHKGKKFFSLQSKLRCEEIRVSIELFSNIKRSFKEILEGRIEDQSNGMMAGFDHTGVCLDYSLPCTIKLDLKDIYLDDSQGEILRAPFYFYYEKGAAINVKVILKNKPADVDFKFFIWYSSVLSKGFHKGSDFFSIQSSLRCPETRVSIELFSNIKGAYYKKQMLILEGRTEDQANDTMADQTFDHTGVCLNYDSPCTIELDLKDIYPVSGTETKTYTVAIASAVSGIALVLLAICVIFAIIKRRKNNSSPVTPRVQKNKVNNPFYVNLLFQKECAKEIENIENHIYEEIKPQKVEVN